MIWLEFFILLGVIALIIMASKAAISVEEKFSTDDRRFDRVMNALFKLESSDATAQIKDYIKSCVLNINNTQKGCLERTSEEIINVVKSQALNAEDIKSKFEEIIKLQTSKEEAKKMLENSIDLLNENSYLKDRQKEYSQFLGIVLQTLKEDTEFLRGSLVRNMPQSIPQVQEFSSQVLNFQNRILMITEALKQNKMIEDLEEEIKDE